MLADSAYGKSGVRLVRVTRRGDRHDVRDLTLAIRFEGDYDASYVDGDNSDVLPTDTMKNTVYALAARGPCEEPESFALSLAEHFLERNPRLQRVTIDVLEHIWRRIASRRDRKRPQLSSPRPREALGPGPAGSARKPRCAPASPTC